MFFGGDDDEQNSVQPNPEDRGGPEAGDYTPPADLPIPGETESIDESHLG